MRSLTVLAKKTVKNQITLPKKIADRFPQVEYFDVRLEDDRVILEPLKADRAAQVREKLARLKLSEADVAKAVAWARKTKA
jgi:bifunctional DNA-binding transcriptional regulator/antitoxin component of YhaV-PrlF toxin-antitoxin module